MRMCLGPRGRADRSGEGELAEVIMAAAPA
jgi:hypothetical protein